MKKGSISVSPSVKSRVGGVVLFHKVSLQAAVQLNSAAESFSFSLPFVLFRVEFRVC